MTPTTRSRVRRDQAVVPFTKARNGLQNLHPLFKSGRRLQNSLAKYERLPLDHPAESRRNRAYAS